MNFPDGRDVVAKAAWPGFRSGRVAHVEEQGSLHLDWNGWIVEVVVVPGMWSAKKVL